MRGMTASKSVSSSLAEEDRRPVGGDVHVALQVVDDPDLVAALLRRLHQAPGGVEFRVAGKDGDLHDGEVAIKAGAGRVQAQSRGTDPRDPGGLHHLLMVLFLGSLPAR